MRKYKNITQIALECDTLDKVLDTSSLLSGWEDTIISLVEQGPLDAGDIPSKSALYDLEEQGYAARTISKGTEPEGNIYATLKGGNLFIQLVLGTYQDHTLQEAIEKRKSQSVSNEGFKDWVKDFFTFKVTDKRINDLANTIKVIEYTTNRISKPLSFSSAYKDLSDIIEFTVKDGVMVKDLPKAIESDAEGFSILSNVLSETNELLDRVNKTDDKDSVRGIIKPFIDTDVFSDVDNREWLFSITTLSKRKKIKELYNEHEFGTITSGQDLYIDDEEMMSDIDRYIKHVNDINTYDQIEQDYIKILSDLNKAFDFKPNDFKKVSKKLSDSFSNYLTEIKQFQKFYEKNKKSQIPEVRELLRIGHRLSAFATWAAERYSVSYYHIQKFTH